MENVLSEVGAETFPKTGVSRHRKYLGPQTDRIRNGPLCDKPLLKLPKFGTKNTESVKVKHRVYL